VIAVDDKSLEMLEFPKIREILAGYTAFSASRELALNLQPSLSPALISLLLKQSAEARHLLTLEPDFSIKGALDIREAARMAAIGKILDPQTLVEIQVTLAAARYVRYNLHKLG
jgi:DNA mismatch repair protein MutS2